MAKEHLSHLVTPFFRNEPVEDKEASIKAGRPIFKDMEVVEVRLAGDRNFSPVFPALSMWARANSADMADLYNVREGDEISYAQRWPDQYMRFKEGNTQIADGTPLEELTFLSGARRAELKALKIYTAEALAALDGKQLKVLGGDGHRFKREAQAYLDKANGHANLFAVASENADLKAQLETMRQQIEQLQGAALQPQAVEREYLPPKSLDEMSDEELRDELEKKTGNRPHHKCARDTLLNMLETVAA